MKNYKYRVRMNGFTKSISTMLFIVFCMTTQVVTAESIDAKTAEHSLSGQVRDAHTKLPINAAQVKTLNGDASATTNELGVFKLKVSSSTALLNVSAFDYNVREFPVQGRDSVVIELYSDVFGNYYKMIEGPEGPVDNIVTTNSIKGVTDLNHTTAVTADEALQTEFGGNVRAINRSGISGMGASLFIRGLNSVNANAQPLFVIDGVIWNNLYDVASIHKGFFSNPLDNIDVNDIESISLMKDGTSLYGSKAANGVILIKTKRATSTVTKINLNIVTGMITTPKILPVMNSAGYKTYVTNIIGTTSLTNSEISQIPFLNDNPARSTYNLYHNNTNWSDQVYQSGVSKSYSINVNGGDEKALYYLTLGYTGNSGVVKTTDFQRYNLRLNADINLFPKVSLGVNVGFSRIDRKLVDDGVDSYTSPTWLSLTKAPFISPYTFTSLGVKTSEYTYADILGIGNPGGIINYSNNTLKQNSFNITLKPVFKVTPSILISEQFDYSLNKSNEDYYRPLFFTYPIYMTGLGYSSNERESQVSRNNSVFSDTRINYVKQFNSTNHLNVFLGTRYINNYYESDYVEGHNSGSNSSVNLPGSFTYLKTDGINNLTKSISNYANADYNYNNRYFLNAAVSMDASSRFGNQTSGGFSLFGHSWGVFPSVNGSWLISSEKFMKYISAVNLLKFRAGYGITGNDDIRDYQTQAYFSSLRFKSVGNGVILTNLANPQIQWETTGRVNLGMDMGLLNDRLALSLDVYSSNTSNLLTLRQFQDVAGLEAYWSNEGKLSNKGAEITLNAKLINLKNLHWEFGLSFGHYVNKITELPNGNYTTQVYGGEVLTSVGNPAGMFYGYKTLGVFATEAQATASKLKIQNNDGTYTSFGAGDVIFEDAHNDGVIDAKDKQIIGNPNPILYGTISNKFSYKKLTLSALFTYSYGNDVYNYQRSQLEAGTDFSNQSTTMLTRWVTEGQVTTQPKAVYGDPMGNARFSDRWIEDGSYIRLKTLMLSYNIPIKNNFIEGINIWVSANNVFTLTKYLGGDPEFSTQNSVLFQGVDAGLIPLSKSYYVGLKFNL